MATLTLEIVTPEGRKLQEEVDELTAPSVEGEFGVLPGHLPILAALRSGVITWRKGGAVGKCAVGTGFIEVSQNHAHVLTSRFMAEKSVDPVTVRAELKTIDAKIEKFTGSPDDPALEALVADELWCAAQLELHGDPPPATVSFVRPYGAAPEAEDGLIDDTAPGAKVDGDKH